MDVNDNARSLNKRVALESIASKLAPTGSAQILWERAYLPIESLGHSRDSTPNSSHTDSARWKVALAAGMPQ